jgi:outer membrane lipoprotein SlyB
MVRLRGQIPALTLMAALAGCGPQYSPDTYASSAAQQANKVSKGVIVGVRPVAISAAGVVGAATGGAAGGIIGSQAGPGITGALGAVGGSLVGGLVGTTVEHAQGDSKAWEYVVKEANGDLVSVTQKGEAALELGQKVLVIAGSQARIVPDYTVEPDKPTATATTTVPPLSPIIVTPLAAPAAVAANPPDVPPPTSSPTGPTAPTVPPPPAPVATPPAPVAGPVPPP